MKCRILTLVAVLMASLPAIAYDFEADGLYYNILSETEVEVTGEIEYDEEDYDYLPGSYSGEIYIPEAVTFEGSSYSVTAIGRYAFRGCQDLTYVEIPYTVTSIGEEAFNGCINLWSVNIPAGVTTLSRRVFWCCFSLTSIEIPYGVTVIEEEALADCNSLEYIYIPSSVTTIEEGAFHSSTSLRSVYMDNGVTSIGSNAFYYCLNLENIDIPSTVSFIGQSALEGTAWLEGQPDGIVYAGTVAYAYKGEMPENAEIVLDYGTTSITASAFNSQTNLKSITIPSSVTSIGDYAFYDCENLVMITCKAPTPPDALLDYVNYVPPSMYTSVNLFVPQSSFSAYSSHGEWSRFTHIIPYLGSGPIETDGIYYTYINGSEVKVAAAIRKCQGEIIIPETITAGYSTYLVTAIDSMAFSGCKGMTKVTIPNTITSIGAWAFSSCVGLTRLTIPSSVTTIGNYAFNWCTSLGEIDIPGTVTFIGNHAFSNCTSLKNIDLPASLRSIENNTFTQCVALSSFVIPDSVTSIGEYAFYYCRGLKEISIPNSVTTIMRCAFYNCISLTSIEIPASVTSVGRSMFAVCTNLASITHRSTTPPQATGALLFQNETERYGEITLYVPAESVMSYQSDEEWGKFTHIVPFIGAGPGDVDGDGRVDISDVTSLIDKLLLGGAPAYCDVDGNGVVDISDVTALIDALLQAH